MIFIRDVDAVHHDGYSIRYVDMNMNFPVELYEPGQEAKRQHYTEEFIQGRVFRKADGTEIVLAWNKKVADTLGIALEAYTNMERQIEILLETLGQMRKDAALKRTELTAKDKRIDKYKRMSFWQRLKFLFGKEPD